MIRPDRQHPRSDVQDHLGSGGRGAPTWRRLAAGLVAAPNTARSASPRVSHGFFQAARPIMTPSARTPPAGSAASV